MVGKVAGMVSEVGLAGVAYANAPQAELPARREAQLTGAPIRQKLQELFPEQNLGSVLREFIKTPVRDPSMLLPGRRDSLVRHSASALSVLASHPNADPAVIEGARVMDKEVADRDLLHHYRMLLMQA